MKKSVIITFILLIGLITLSVNIMAENAGEGKNMLDSNKDRLEVLPLELGEFAEKEMVSLRELGQVYGWDFTYDAEEKIISIYSQNERYQFKIGEAVIEDKNLADEKVIPVIKEGRTYLDLEIIDELVVRLGEVRPRLVTTLGVTDDTIKVKEDFKALIGIYNISDEMIRLHYASGQLYDLYLKRGEKILWRWSEDKFFTMALQYKDLKPGDRLSYEIEVTGISDGPGGYLLGGEISTKSPIPLPEIDIELDN